MGSLRSFHPLRMLKTGSWMPRFRYLLESEHDNNGMLMSHALLSLIKLICCLLRCIIPCAILL